MKIINDQLKNCVFLVNGDWSESEANLEGDDSTHLDLEHPPCSATSSWLGILWSGGRIDI